MRIRKYISSLLILSILASFSPPASAASIGRDFNVKITTAGDETYTTNLTNVSRNNTDITFQFVEASNGGAEEYSISLPAGVTYQSHNTTGTDCSGFNVHANTNSNFHFSFNGAGNCLAKTEFTYRITASASTGNQSISLLDVTNSTLVTSIVVEVTATNSITKAVSKDLNNNGYIDAYLLSFTTVAGVDATALSTVTVAGVTTSAATASGSDWILPFTDGVLSTSSLPQIGGMFSTVSLTNGSINEEDGAKPQIMKINSVVLSTLWVGQSVSIGTGALDLEFSERMIPTSTGAFTLSLGGSPVTGTFSYNALLDKLTFTPTSALQAGSYSLTATIAATDWSVNNNPLSQTLPTLIVSDITTPTGAPLGSGNGILINAGNLATNNSSVQLQFLASDNVGVADMMISNVSNFAGASWETYATSKYNWALTAGTGTKTVYVKFRDFAGNPSVSYSDTIVYDNLLSYVNFDVNSSIYTDATSIILSGACNYVSSVGVVLGTTINTYVGAVNIWTVTCTSNRWTQNFSGLTASSTNTLKVEYVGDPTVNSTMVVTNPVPSCTSVTNGVVSGTYPSCTFSCNAGYTKVGGGCVANNCSASSQTVNGHSYSVGAFNNSTTSSINSSSVSISNGSIIYNQTFSCTLGTVATSGVETPATPTCNSGYQVSGYSCIAISVGGWGGGGSLTPTDSCPTGDKSGNLYDGRCNAPTTSTGTTNTGGTVSTGTSVIPVASWIPPWFTPPSDLSANTIDMRYFPVFEDARKFLLLQITHSAIVKLINAYGDKLTIADDSYFLSIDRNFYSEYNRIINAYTLLFLRVQDAVSGNRSDVVKSDGRFSASVVTSGVAFAKNFLNTYISREYVSGKNITLYRTKNPLLSKALSALEGKILTKFDALLVSGTISRSEYDTSVQAYNDFVLHLMIYRDYGKNPLSKDRALKAIKIFTTTYAKKIAPKSEPTIDRTLEQERQAYIENNPTSSPQKIGEIYTFPRDLKFGETGQKVSDLQAILKSYGYFGTLNPTGFFGTLTKTYLIEFSKEVLGIDNPEGLFDARIREAIINLTVK